ncbi:MAG: beta-ketoacyl-ACP synthase 3, partial [Spirochaetota bacterium]
MNNQTVPHQSPVRPVHIISFDYYVPERILSNCELAQTLDTSDEWIVSHTGIRERHIATEEQASSDLASIAARRVLQKSGISAPEIDLIVLATASPDYNSFPATACVVQEKLGCHRAAAFDLTAACTGFVYALEVAQSMLAANPKYTHALVIGAEVFSKIVNWQDRSTCVLFGDGAGAALLRAQPETGGIQIRDTLLKSDGSGAEKLWVPEGGSRNSL